MSYVDKVIHLDTNRGFFLVVFLVIARLCSSDISLYYRMFASHPT